MKGPKCVLEASHIQQRVMYTACWYIYVDYTATLAKCCLITKINTANVTFYS